MASFSTKELANYHWMQGRMIELLLRHDVEQYNQTFRQQGNQAAAQPDHLTYYRNLALLIHLQEELFMVILPQIKRRLSFANPHTINTETFPTKGKIDWNRTHQANLRDRPTEFPLEVKTQQRRRNFATAENLLTVCSILEYQQLAELLVGGEFTGQAEAQQHPLYDLIQTCRQELIFPQFAGLVAEANAIIAGHTTTVEDLEDHVQAQLIAGRNSAYDQLLEWRHMFATLALYQRTALAAEQLSLGADPQRDNYLYQLWIYYELLDYLQRHNCLVQAIQDKPLSLTFTWGKAATNYTLRHDQSTQIKEHWDYAPGVRPDFFIAPTNAQHAQGYLLDAKYYKPHFKKLAPSNPVKRMIADLQLLDQRHGALLFAFLETDNSQPSKPEVQTQSTESPEPSEPDSISALKYKIKPFDHAHGSFPETEINIWCLTPQADGLDSTLEQLLNQVDQTLSAQLDPKCYGTFFDSLGTNAHGEMNSLLKLRTTIELDDLVLCPKPHISQRRIELVSLSHDCCTNPHVCHITQFAERRKPQRLTNLAEISQAIRMVEGDDEQRISLATQQVQAIVQRFADLIKPNLANYQAWIEQKLEIGSLFNSTPLLSQQQRQTLALARFLWHQIEYIQADNFAGPTLLFSGVLEELCRATIYDVSPPIKQANGKKLQQTLGTLATSKKWADFNWRLIQQAVEPKHWQAQIAQNQRLSLAQWMDKLETIAQTRNNAAHKAFINAQEFQQLINNYFGGLSSGYGVINGLLLAWQA